MFETVNGAAAGYPAGDSVEYLPLGNGVNLASRLGAHAGPGRIVVNRRVPAPVDEGFDVEALGELSFKGFQRPVPAFSLLGGGERAGSAEPAR